MAKRPKPPPSTMPAPIIADFTATPSTLPEGGGTVTFNAQTWNSLRNTINGMEVWFPHTMFVSGFSPQMFTLVATGQTAPPATANVTVTIVQNYPPPVPSLPPPAPTITSFTPTTGPDGTTVVITGTNLTGALAVSINSLPVESYTVLSATSISATVAIGTTTGRVSVTTPGGTANSSGNFTASGGGSSAPTVTSFSPTTGAVGTVVTITGTNFTGATVVRFNTTNASSFTVLSPTSITATVATGTVTGVVAVTTAAGTGTSSGSFTVTSGGVINAASLLPSDIQTAINTATVGQTVQLPAGARTYVNGDAITNTKGIKIRGAGGGRLEGKCRSSATIGSGSKTFTIKAGTVPSMYSGGPGFVAGDVLRAVYWPDGANYMQGTVTSWTGYSWNQATRTGTDGTLVLNVTTVGGSGTHALWVFETAAQTTLTTNMTTGSLFTLTKDAAASMEFSDFRVIKTGTGNSAAKVFSIADNSSWTGEPPKFHDMRFSAQIVQDVIHATANGGLIYRCYGDTGFFLGTGNGYVMDQRLIAVKNFDPDNWGWHRTETQGAADTTGKVNWYVEDCYFNCCGLWTDYDDNARGVNRYCIYDNSCDGTHGSDSSGHGMLHVERYNNRCYYDEHVTQPAPPPAGEVNAAPNLQGYFEWRGGTGVLIDCDIEPIYSGWWGDKPEVSVQMQGLQRLSNQWGMWGKNTAYYPTNYTGNVPSSPGAYPMPRQAGMGHPGTGNLTSDIQLATATKSIHAKLTTTHTVPATGDVLTGMDENSTPVWLGKLSPMYQNGCVDIGGQSAPRVANFTTISGQDYQTTGTFEDNATDPSHDFTHYAHGADYFQTGRDWINGAKPGWSKYAYPHPLRT